MNVLGRRASRLELHDLLMGGGFGRHAPAMKFLGDALTKTTTAIRERDWATAMVEAGKAAAHGGAAMGGADRVMPLVSKALSRRPRASAAAARRDPAVP